MLLTNVLLVLILVTLILGRDVVVSVFFAIPYEYAKNAIKQLKTGDIGKAYTVVIAIFIMFAAAYGFMVG